jgi:hypothetical protein
LFLAGDHEASELSDRLTRVQTEHQGQLSKYLAKEALHHLEDLHAITSSSKSSDWIFRVAKFKPAAKHTSLDSAKAALVEIENRFAQFAGENSGNN